MESKKKILLTLSTILIIFLCLITFQVQAVETNNSECIYLSDCEWVKAVNGYTGPVQKDIGQQGNYKLSLTVDGITRQIKKGISIHATGYVDYDISEFSTEYPRFYAQVGIDASQGTKGSIIFRVYKSEDLNNWELIEETGVLTGGKNAYEIDLDVAGCKYIRIYIDKSTGGNANDHTTIGEAKLVRKDFDPSVGPYDKFRKVEYYDNILSKCSLEENYTNNYNLVLKREVVRRLGYWNIQDMSQDNPKILEMLDWINSSDVILEQVIETDLSNPTQFMTVLANLYDKYKSCLTEENGDVYQKMMIGLATGYTADKTSSPLTFNHITPSYDYIERFSIIKKLYDDGMFLYGKGFKEYHIEFFRYIMNDSPRNDEVRWMNFIGRAKNYATGVYSYVNYVKPNYSKSARPQFYDIANKDEYERRYHLEEYGVPFADNTTRFWMVHSAGGICWNQARFTKSTLIAMGRPSITVYQPEHESALFYTAANSDGTGKGTWSITGNIFGWGKTSNAWYGGNKTRTLFNWSRKSFAFNSTNASTSGDSAGYVWLAQDNLNNYPAYKKSVYYNLIANSYANNEDKVNVYNESLKVNPINLDTYDYKIQAYKALNKTSGEWHQLALDVIENYKFYPMAMGDLIKVIKPYLNGVDRVDIDQRYYDALVVAKGTNPTACKQIATARLGSASNKLASFSFDGANAGKIILSKDYDAFPDIMWKYSLDGGATKSEGTLSHAFQLSKEEIAKINSVDDIKLYIVGLTEANPTYTIDIVEGTMGTDLYGNDLENRVIGIDSTYEWRNSENETWKTYENATLPDNTGDKTLYVRKKATGNNLASASTTFQFTQDADTATRKYIPIEHLSVVGYSTQSQDSKRPYYAPNAIDGNRNTLWHTHFGEHVITSGNTPYYIIKLDRSVCLSAVEFVQTKYKVDDPAFIKNMTVYVSDDNENWIKAGRIENCAKNEEFKAIEFEESIFGQYVKLQMETYDMFSSLAMINLFEDTTKKVVASFSFDGKNPGTISLYEEYEGRSWSYSIDGGNDWKKSTGDSHTLTKEELKQINEENRIKIKFDNDENIYTLTIKKGEPPVISSSVYLNDLENRLIGMTNTSNLEWKFSDDETWTSYDDEEPIAKGDRILQIRNKATGICAPSNSVEYRFTEDNQPDTRKYIPVKHLSVAGFSAEDLAQNGAAANAIDANYNTRWLNSSAGTDTERYIIIEFDSPVYLSAMDYVPHSENGKILGGTIEGSMDGETFTPIAEISGWANNQNTKTINFAESVEVKYVKIIGTNTNYTNAKRHVGARMFNFYKDTTKSVPSTELIYSTKKLTNQDVEVTLIEEDTPITITNNNGSNKYIFKENGSFTFEFEGANGKNGTATANVDWIDKKVPVATVGYNINEKTNQDVTATVMFDKENVTVEGGNTYTFIENGTHIFKFVDEAGNEGTAEAEVTWIAKQAPKARIEYSITTPTNQDVIATIIFEDDDVMVVNGEAKYTFTSNGKYTFNFVDSIGNEGSAEAEVTWIDKTLSVATIEYDIKELTNKDVTATIKFDNEAVEVKDGKTTHTFTENGEYIFEYEVGGRKGSAIAKVDWIDKVAPIATIEYSATHKTNEDVIATITFDKNNVTVKDGNTHTFTENGEYIFEFKDKAGNTGTATATVNWIDRTLPVATIQYDIETLTNQDVVATITFDEENVTVKDGNTHTFTENGEYEFEFTDASKNKGTAIARVDWIDKVVPNATVSYDILETTNQDVVATVVFDKENVTVKDGNTHTFTENGEYIFEFVDSAGNTGTAVAMVSWIQKEASGVDVTFDIGTLTNKDVEATLLFEKDVIILNEDLAIVKHANNRYSLTFTSNATVIVEYQDMKESKDAEENKEENKGTKTIKVDWIDKEAPTATVSYDIETATNKDVVARLNPSEDIIIKNNDAKYTHTFTDNGEFTFEFVDRAGNEGTATATVDWIDKVAPTATVEYDIREETTGSVVASLVNESEEITITNNDGKNTYTFTENGSFTFEFADKAGNTGTAMATVDWIVTEISTEPGFKVDLTSSKEKLNPGEEFEINISISDLKNIGNGLIAITGKFEYDENILELLDIQGQNEWNMDENSFNEDNFRFVTENGKYITESGDVIKLKLKVKETIEESTETILKVSSIVASNGEQDISATEKQIKLNIEKEAEEEASITSEKYKIEENTIARILPDTTFEIFKENVTANKEISIINENGEAIKDTDIIKTGMTLKVGEELEFSLIVIGDIDGDGRLSPNDLASLKLHIIEKEGYILTGNRFKAGDIDGDGKATVNDVAQLKMLIVGLLELK